MSLAGITALIYGLVGFLIALTVAAFTIAGIVGENDFQGSAALVMLFNIGAGLLLGVLTSLLTALFGWVNGYITAAIYNWFAKKAGGIKIELEEVAAEAKQAKTEEKKEETKNQPTIT